MLRFSTRLVILTLTVALLLRKDVIGDKKQDKPNVLLIMADDQDLLLSSLDFMPKVKEQIGSNGITFNKHYCTSAFCCPSRVSLYTGKCVHNTNVTSVVTPYGGYPKYITEGLNDDNLPLWLQQGGVNTYYVGKFANSHNIHNYRKDPIKGWTQGNYLLEPGTYDYMNTTWAMNTEPWKSFPGENAIDVSTKHALSMIDVAVDANKPWFMTVAPAVPHVGINATNGHTFFPIPQPKWKDAFADARVPRTGSWNPDSMEMGASWLLNLPHQNQTMVDALDDLYRARARAMAGLDDMVGDLISSLDSHGVLENTHIIYTSDNGYHIGQHRLGPGKKLGYETDVNIPMIWRGPGVKTNHISEGVSTHTDLAPTFLSLFGLPMRSKLDGRVMSEITGTDDADPGEHVNIELWGAAEPYEVQPVSHIHVRGARNNTYKGLRLVSDEYSLYYSVWCTNEHELYDMKADTEQTRNLLPNTKDISNVSSSSTYLDRPLDQVVTRLDALLMVLKTCVGRECTEPWAQLHPQNNVKNLKDALAEKYDSFYAVQPKVTFSACKLGYLSEFEGAQAIMQFSTGSKTRPQHQAVSLVLTFAISIWLCWARSPM